MPCGYREDAAFEKLEEGHCGWTRESKEERHRPAPKFS